MPRSLRDHTTCAAQPALAALTARDAEVMIRALAPAQCRDLFRSLGLRLKTNRLPAQTAQLVAARLRSAPPSAAHYVAGMVASVLGPSLLAAIGSDDDNHADTIEETTAALPELVAQWSAGLVRVMVVALWEASAIDADDRTRLLACLDDMEGGLAPASPREVAGAVDAAEAPASPGAATSPARPRGLVESTIAVTDPLAESAAAAYGIPLGDLDLLVIAAARRGGAQDAARQLLDLDPARAAAWVVAGFAGATPRDPDHTYAPLSPARARCSLVGRLAAAIEHDADTEVARAALEDRDGVEDVVRSAAGSLLVGQVVTAVAPSDPRWAARLLTLAPSVPACLANAVAALREAARDLLDSDLAAAESVLALADEALTRWAGSGQPLGDAHRVSLEREAAGLTLLRASCRRRRHDFAGAQVLLDERPEALLDAGEQAIAAVERALVAAELSGVTGLRLPQTATERAAVADRLARAADHTATALARDPEHAGAHLLAAAAAIARRDDAAAVHHLDRAAPLSGEGLPPQARAELRAQRALAQLRLLEPGTAPAAYDALLGALHDAPPAAPDLIVDAVHALEAHGSPLVAALLEHAGASAARHEELVDVLVRNAEDCDEGTGRLACSLAADDEVPLRTRARLLEASLTGAGERSDRAAALRAAGALEEVLARACDDELDSRWSAVLESNATMRTLLGPAHADAARIEVLRRLGRIAEARDATRRLFFRAAAGTVPDFDPRDLLDLLGDLGPDEDEVRELRRLVAPPDPPAGGPTTKALVLVVGGDEAHRRRLASVEAALLGRFGASVTLEWHPTGWGSNWARHGDAVEARYPDAGAVVLLTLMRTMLGERLRRTAGEAGLPWVACAGRGSKALERAVDRALELMRA